MKTYRVEVMRDSFGEGTCNVPTCGSWGVIHLSFRDIAAIACSDGHVLTAAIELVRSTVRSNVKWYRVQTCTVRYERVETIIATSDQIEGPRADTKIVTRRQSNDSATSKLVAPRFAAPAR